MSRSRSDTLAILRGERIGRLPVFSGLPSLTAEGLRAAGVRYNEAHTDAAKMARAAASTFERYGFESAVVPFDLCVEAEALGCEVDFQRDVDAYLAPVVSKPRIADGEWQMAIRHSRIPLVAEAIGQLKNTVGREVVIGAWVPGPFTLAWQLFGAEAWLSSLGRTLEVEAALEITTQFIVGEAQHYMQAGADFITVHEMGGSPQVIGAKHFRSFVQPALKRLFAALPSPNVLSLCGDTNMIVADLAACGADALHLDQCNDLARTRRLLGAETVLLGNFDPVKILSEGTPDTITQTVKQIAAAGANAIWPGCDLWPEIPDENFRALMATARQQTADR